MQGPVKGNKISLLLAVETFYQMMRQNMKIYVTLFVFFVTGDGSGVQDHGTPSQVLGGVSSCP
jgi:hypothetical protein